MKAEKMFENLGFELASVESDPSFVWRPSNEQWTIFRRYNSNDTHTDVEFCGAYKTCRIITYQNDTYERIYFEPLTPEIIEPIKTVMKELGWIK